MCMYIKRCKNYVAVPTSKLECGVLCKRNLVIIRELSDYVTDWFVEKDKEEFVYKQLTKPNLVNTTLPNDDYMLVLDPTEKLEEEFIPIKEIRKRNINEDDDDGLIEVFDTTEETLEEEQDEVKYISIKEIQSKRQDVEKKIEQVSGKCPYCNKTFKNLQVHLRFCKIKKTEEIESMHDENKEEKDEEQEKDKK